MSIKDDIEMVKEELTSEEKFFEKSVITERFIKKYKNIMIGGVVALVVLIAGNIAYNINQESTLKAANESFNDLMIDAKNEKALSRLQTLSPSLYDVYIYSVAIANKDMQALEQLKSSKSAIISDLASYESSTDAASLEAYTLVQGAIYKDLAQVQSAISLMNEGKTEKAHEKLLLISDNSSLSQVAKALLHYGVK
ncbi:MAG: hypothetical protein Q9M32_07160 [Sulfurimonas sp.]|nr:hypothetical protein [Sulfurimonas sp.]MDQ7061391.1 hypothetical protein [Sulfurimonas sp.]